MNTIISDLTKIELKEYVGMGDKKADAVFIKDFTQDDEIITLSEELTKKVFEIIVKIMPDDIIDLMMVEKIFDYEELISFVISIMVVLNVNPESKIVPKVLDKYGNLLIDKLLTFLSKTELTSEKEDYIKTNRNDMLERFKIEISILSKYQLVKDLVNKLEEQVRDIIDIRKVESIVTHVRYCSLKVLIIMIFYKAEGVNNGT